MEKIIIKKPSSRKMFEILKNDIRFGAIMKKLCAASKQFFENISSKYSIILPRSEFLNIFLQQRVVILNDTLKVHTFIIACVYGSVSYKFVLVSRCPRYDCRVGRILRDSPSHSLDYSFGARSLNAKSSLFMCTNSVCLRVEEVSCMYRTCTKSVNYFDMTSRVAKFTSQELPCGVEFKRACDFVLNRSIKYFLPFTIRCSRIIFHYAKFFLGCIKIL